MDAGLFESTATPTSGLRQSYITGAHRAFRLKHKSNHPGFSPGINTNT